MIIIFSLLKAYIYAFWILTVFIYLWHQWQNIWNIFYFSLLKADTPVYSPILAMHDSNQLQTPFHADFLKQFSLKKYN